MTETIINAVVWLLAGTLLFLAARRAWSDIQFGKTSTYPELRCVASILNAAGHARECQEARHVELCEYYGVDPHSQHDERVEEIRSAIYDGYATVDELESRLRHWENSL